MHDTITLKEHLELLRFSNKLVNDNLDLITDNIRLMNDKTMLMKDKNQLMAQKVNLLKRLSRKTVKSRIRKTS